MYPVVPASTALACHPLKRIPVGCRHRVSDLTLTAIPKIPELNPRRLDHAIERSSGSRARRHFRCKLEKPTTYPLIERFAPYKEHRTDDADSRALCEVKAAPTPTWLPPTPSIDRFPALTFLPEPDLTSSFSESWQIPSPRPEVSFPINSIPVETKLPAAEECLCKTIKKHLSQAWAGITWLIEKSLYIPKQIALAFGSDSSHRNQYRKYR